MAGKRVTGTKASSKSPASKKQTNSPSKGQLITNYFTAQKKNDDTKRRAQDMIAQSNEVTTDPPHPKQPRIVLETANTNDNSDTETDPEYEDLIPPSSSSSSNSSIVTVNNNNSSNLGASTFEKDQVQPIEDIGEEDIIVPIPYHEQIEMPNTVTITPMSLPASSPPPPPQTPAPTCPAIETVVPIHADTNGDTPAANTTTNDGNNNNNSQTAPAGLPALPTETRTITTNTITFEGPPTMPTAETTPTSDTTPAPPQVPPLPPLAQPDDQMNSDANNNNNNNKDVTTITKPPAPPAATDDDFDFTPIMPSLQVAVTVSPRPLDKTKFMRSLLESNKRMREEKEQRKKFHEEYTAKMDAILKEGTEFIASTQDSSSAIGPVPFKAPSASTTIHTETEQMVLNPFPNFAAHEQKFQHQLSNSDRPLYDALLARRASAMHMLLRHWQSLIRDCTYLKDSPQRSAVFSIIESVFVRKPCYAVPTTGSEFATEPAPRLPKVDFIDIFTSFGASIQKGAGPELSLYKMEPFLNPSIPYGSFPIGNFQHVLRILMLYLQHLPELFSDNEIESLLLFVCCCLASRRFYNQPQTITLRGSPPENFITTHDVMSQCFSKLVEVYRNRTVNNDKSSSSSSSDSALRQLSKLIAQRIPDLVAPTVPFTNGIVLELLPPHRIRSMIAVELLKKHTRSSSSNNNNSSSSSSNNNSSSSSSSEDDTTDSINNEDLIAFWRTQSRNLADARKQNKPIEPLLTRLSISVDLFATAYASVDTLTDREHKKNQKNAASSDTATATSTATSIFTMAPQQLERLKQALQSLDDSLRAVQLDCQAIAIRSKLSLITTMLALYRDDDSGEGLLEKKKSQRRLDECFHFPSKALLPTPLGGDGNAGTNNNNNNNANSDHDEDDNNTNNGRNGSTEATEAIRAEDNDGSNNNNNTDPC